jgi:pilus assembly protein CpaE
MGSPHIDGEGLCLITVGLDIEAADTARKVALQEGVKLVSAFSDYPQGSFHGQLARQLEGAKALVCLIDFDGSKDLAAQTAVSIQPLMNGRTTLMAVSADEHPDLILNAMRAGCSEYLTKPMQADVLSSCLRKLRARWLAASLDASPAGGRVLAFLGVSGGAGATTIAVHLGTFLAKRQGQKSLIIDQHPHLGHVAMLMGMDSHSYHFHDLLCNIDRLDPTLLSSYVAHHASGADVLPSSDSLEQGTVISADALERSVQFLADAYNFVLLDCSGDLNELKQVITGCCDEVYLVATPELPALRDLARYVARLLEWRVPAAKSKVVINQQGPHCRVTVEQIEQAIGHPVNIILPASAAELIRAVDTGEPISSDSKSEFASQIRKWASSLAPIKEAPRETKRRLAFWR